MRTPPPASFVPSPRMQPAAMGFIRFFEKHGGKASLIAAALVLGGCQTMSPTPTGQGGLFGSMRANDAQIPDSPRELAEYTARIGQQYDANPNDKRTALIYAQALRRSTRYAQAVAVLQRLAAAYPKDMLILGTYGKALVDAGRLQEAAEVLPQAHTPENPDWTILSAQGTVADQLGDHAKAQEYYQAALKIAPNQPDVLSNLGLSYALSKQLPLAEQTMQLAVAQPNAGSRVRQNLSLVLALEGKFDAAQHVAERDIQPIEAAENVAAIRQMVAQANPWTDIKALDGKARHRVASRVAKRNVTQKVATRTPKPQAQTQEQAARIE